jgi:hypothetical protein
MTCIIIHLIHLIHFSQKKMLFHYPHSVILCVVFAQLIANNNIELADQFSLSCYLKTRGYQEPELLNPLLFPTHSCNICAGLNSNIICQV